MPNFLDQIEMAIITILVVSLWFSVVKHCRLVLISVGIQESRNLNPNGQTIFKDGQGTLL